jgi:putative FmdB family regulatory protein
MPIFEFKCLTCNECFEILVVKTEDAVEMRCPHCRSEDFERIMSCTNHSISHGSGPGEGIKSQSRKCSGGSCATIELPGHSR